MNFLFKYFAKQIIIDVHPSRFTFTCSKDDVYFSIATFVYVDNSQAESIFIAIGQEIPNNYVGKPNIYRINVFNLDEELPPKTTFSREKLTQAIIEFGLGKIYEKYIFPRLRPVVFILGADRLNGYFRNPRDELRISAKCAGAKEVVFDKLEI